MIEPSELDMAMLHYEMRELYKHIGFDRSLQALYEMMLGAQVFAEVIVEERRKEEPK